MERGRSSRMLLQAITGFSIVFLVRGCSEVDMLEASELCEKLQEFHIDYVNETNSVTDMELYTCCHALRFLECLEDVLDEYENCTVDHDLLLERKFRKNVECMMFNKSSCTDLDSCDDDVTSRCYSKYKTKIIHIIEDPKLTHEERPAVLCCALKDRGQCVVKAAYENQCAENNDYYKQPPGLTEYFGACDIFGDLTCGSSRHGSCSLLLFICSALFYFKKLFI